MSKGWTHLFFDIGGVLGTNGWDGQQRAAARQRFGLEAEFEDRHAEVAGDWETGLLDLDEYLDCTVFFRPREFTRDVFIKFMEDQSVPDAKVLALVRAIGSTGNITLMTMNNEAEFLNLYRIEKFGLRELFGAFLSSCWLGTRKPARRFFEHGLAIAQAEPARSIFVDDREQNLTPARALGMTAVHFEGERDLAGKLGQLGLRPKA